MGLPLGLPLCRSHTCQHCGAEVSQFATHCLSCRKSAGCHHRHSAVNDFIHRALVAAHLPSCLEPSGLYRSDGKRPDGVSTVPWKCGQFLAWDAPCPETPHSHVKAWCLRGSRLWAGQKCLGPPPLDSYPEFNLVRM